MLLTHEEMWYHCSEIEQESKIKPENKMTKGVLSSKCYWEANSPENSKELQVLVPMT